MRMYDIIKKKRDGKVLSEKEIAFFVDGYTSNEIPDYQASALLMAIYLKGMTKEETVALTMSMAHSGDMIDLSGIVGLKADKHSTGGVGDKTTLIVAPIVAACGVKVAKMSGKGLGHTGGTIDKLDSIKGYQSDITEKRFIEITNKIGLSIIGQSGNLAPADKKIYALRDVTATVDSLPLIVSSIMSKKIAVGADCIVLDVKAGSGSFCKTKYEANNLAKALVSVGKGAGKAVTAIITNMDIPLGKAVGNSLEVIEAMEVLAGYGEEDLREVSLELAANMLYLTKKGDMDTCHKMAVEALESGAAKKIFIDMIKAQGGNTDMLEDCELFPKTKYKKEINSQTKGIITKMDTEKIGIASVLLGAGRLKKEDTIDYAAGLLINKKTGDAVEKGEVLVTMFAEKEKMFENAEKVYLEGIKISKDKKEQLPLILGRISSLD